MIGAVAIVLFVGYLGLCLASVFVNQRLLRQFVTKRPDLAAKYLPEAAGSLAHPKKLLFFLKPVAAKILSGDQELLQLRNRLVSLVWGLVLYLILILVLMLVAATIKL